MSARARSSFVAVIALLVGLLLVTGAPGATAASERGEQQRDAAAERRQRVIDFWTAERVRNATPRQLAVAPPRDPSVKPDGSGNGNGKGGGKPGGGADDGGSTDGGTTEWVTTGTSWPLTPDTVVKRTTGKAFFVVGGRTYVCSGSVVQDSRADHDLVLTAGHCVHDGDGRTWATNWMFVPDYDTTPASYTSNGSFCSQTRFGCWVADELVTTSRWAAVGDFDDDAGFAVVGPGGKSSPTTQLATAVTGAHAISFTSGPKVLNAFSFGYPHASPYDGTDLVYCAGTTIADPYGYDTRGLDCAMTGGSSGGPWYLADSAGSAFDGSGVGTAISVNSYKYTRGKNSKYMFGPVFGTPEQAAYNTANSPTSTAAPRITFP